MKQNFQEFSELTFYLLIISWIPWSCHWIEKYFSSLVLSHRQPNVMKKKVRNIIFYNFCCRMLKWCITIIYCMKILLNSNQYNKYGKYFEKYEYLEWIMKWLLFIKQKMNEKWYLIRCIIYVLVARLKYSTWICFWRLFNYS